MMAFYNSLGVDIIRVRNVFGSDVGDLEDDVKSEFLRRGYSESNGMLVKGRLVTQCFEQTDLLNVVFVLQHLEESNKMKDMNEALTSFGGLRSDVEALLRVRKFEPIQKLHKRGEVYRCRIVPDRMGYCTMESASLYRAARAADLIKDEKLVMRIVRDQQPVKRQRLLDLSPLGNEDTSEAIRSLYRSSRLCMDSTIAYVATKRQNTSNRVAWARIFARLFDNFGVMSAESLSMLTGHEMPMREL